MDTLHREKFPGSSIKLLQVRGPPMNDTKTVSENWQCKPIDGQNLVPTVQLGPDHHLYSMKVLTLERLPHSAVLDTITLVHTQILVDLTWFQTVDGVCFPYHHPRIVSRELAVDKVCNSTLVLLYTCLDQTHLDVIRAGTNLVQQLFQLIRISAIHLQIIHVK